MLVIVFLLLFRNNPASVLSRHAAAAYFGSDVTLRIYKRCKTLQSAVECCQAKKGFLKDHKYEIRDDIRLSHDGAAAVCCLQYFGKYMYITCQEIDLN